MSYHPIEVANKFISLFHKDGQGVKHVSLQKLLYIAHGSYLAITGTPLVAKGFEAWDYGPVTPLLYSACSQYGREQISHLIDFPLASDPCHSSLEQNDVANIVIGQVYDHFKNYSPSQLITFTHAQGGPWDEVYESGRKSIPMSDDKISTYFKTHFLKADKQQG